MVRRKKRKAKVAAHAAALDRTGEILAAGMGTENDARTYFKHLYTGQLARLQSIAAIAEKERNWEFMEGCIKQATDLYVLAATLYEKFPEHVILSDGAFDGLAKFLLKNQRTADKEFWNWYNVTSMGLKAGSGYNVVAHENIKWMVYLLTGTNMGDDDERPSRNRTGLLRKPVKRRRKPTEGGTGSAPKRRLRKSKK